MAAEREVPPHVEEFLARYPVDERAQEYLLGSSSQVVETAVREFKPKTEGEADYSGLVTSYVKRLRMNANAAGENGGYVGGGKGGHAGAQGGQWPAHRAPAPAWKGAPASGPYGSAKGGHKGSAVEHAEPDPALLEAAENFVQKYPVDDGAFKFLIGSSPEVMDRVINEFKPKSEGDSDYSALLMTFVKRCRGDNHSAPVHHQSTSRHQAAPSQRDLDDFFQRYPVDERAMDYFGMGTPEVQAKILRDFKPKVEGEADYSGLLTSFCKRTKTHAQEDQYASSAFHYGPVGAAPGFGGKGKGRAPMQPMHQARRAVGPSSRELDDFARKYPMDERAWSYLTSSSPEVMDKVMYDFAPKRLDDTDYSAPITAYVKVTRRGLGDAPGFASNAMQHVPNGGYGAGSAHQARHGSSNHYDDRRDRHHDHQRGRDARRDDQRRDSSSGDQDAELRRFLNRYPVDERAMDYLSMQPPDVIGKVLGGFKPKKEGDSDYSAIVMSFTKRCRDQDAPRGGSSDSGTPWKRART